MKNFGMAPKVFKDEADASRIRIAMELMAYYDTPSCVFTSNNINFAKNLLSTFTMESQEINHIGFMMEQALATMSSSLATNLKAIGIDLPHSQYAVMRLIYSCPEPISQIKISEILKKDAAAIKRTLDILERKGYIIRQAHNGRTNIISCTPEALAQKSRIIDTANETLHQLFCGFKHEDIKTFYQLLDKLAQQKK